MSVSRLQAIIVAAGLVAAPVSAAAFTSAIVVDAATGFAIDGFDPVAYFADAAAREGRPGHEAEWGGAAWRFANEGNRAAFMENPEVYAPAFGGHCVVAVARGYAGAGDPRIWAIVEGRVYFFYSQANRRMFLDQPDAFIEDAVANADNLFTW